MKTSLLLSCALALLCSGCFLAPGMRMDESALADRGHGASNEAAFKVVPITPAVLAAQVKARMEADQKRRALTPPPPPDTDYRIAAHDVLSVIVWEHPELTIPAGEFRSADASGYPVGSDGSIFVPHVGLVQVAGHTPEEVRKTLGRIEVARKICKIHNIFTAFWVLSDIRKTQEGNMFAIVFVF